MFCDIDGTETYCEIVGEGTPVLALHGFGVDHRLMKSCLEPVFAHRPGYRRIYFDQPGMGRTKAGDWLTDADRLLDFVVHLVEKVVPDERFLVAGSSYGGYLARGLAYRLPGHVEGLLLSVPTVIAVHAKRDLPPKQFIYRDEAFLSRLTPAERENFELTGTVLDGERWSRVAGDVLPALKLADEPGLERMQQGRYAFSFDDGGRFGAFDRPALLVAGRQDTAVGYRDALRLMDDLPRGTFAILDRAAHNLEFEQEAVFQCLVNEWLDRVEEYRASKK